jgi:hypothetical protein
MLEFVDFFIVLFVNLRQVFLFFLIFCLFKKGGRFVIEIAPYKDYIKHCNKKGGDKPPQEVLNNLSKINFHPEEFTEYLLNIVGFNHHEELNTPQSKHLGIFFLI